MFFHNSSWVLSWLIMNWYIEIPHLRTRPCIPCRLLPKGGDLVERKDQLIERLLDAMEDGLFGSIAADFAYITSEQFWSLFRYVNVLHSKYSHHKTNFGQSAEAETAGNLARPDLGVTRIDTWFHCCARRLETKWSDFTVHVFTIYCITRRQTVKWSGWSVPIYLFISSICWFLILQKPSWCWHEGTYVNVRISPTN